MDVQTVIDGMVETIVKGEELRENMTWEEMKKRLSPVIGEEKVGLLQKQIIQSFGTCREKQWTRKIEETRRHTQMLMGTNLTTPEPRTFVTNGLPSPPSTCHHPESADSDSSSLLEQATESPPEIDKSKDVSWPSCLPLRVLSSPLITFQPEGTRYMAVHLPDTAGLEGAGFQYCKGPMSYVSSSWLETYELLPIDGIIWLRWHRNGTHKTILTKFSVDDSIDCDFLLGERHMDKDYNKKKNKIVTEPISGMPRH